MTKPPDIGRITGEILDSLPREALNHYSQKAKRTWWRAFYFGFLAGVIFACVVFLGTVWLEGPK